MSRSEVQKMCQGMKVGKIGLKLFNWINSSYVARYSSMITVVMDTLQVMVSYMREVQVTSNRQAEE